jgi:beta-mannosidase
MENHQRCPMGNTPIFTMFGKYYRMPHGFRNFLYLSQVQQAAAIQTGVEYWRTLRPRCMGTIYWQLNDIWPVISWASLEYSGKWKQLMYSARRFFAPVLVTALKAENGDVNIHLVSDLMKEAKVNVTARVMDFNGKVLKTIKMKASVKPGESMVAGKLAAADVEKLDKRRCFMTIAMNGDAAGENTYFFEPYKNCDLEEANIIAAVSTEKGKVVVDITTDKPVFNVAVDTIGLKGIFSDNNFTLLPGESKKLVFEAPGKVTAAQMEKAMTIFHLRGSYE